MEELTPKEQAFIEHYLTSWNGAESARNAGYSARTAKEQASRLLTKVNVQAAIQARLNELKLTADEVLARLGKQARASFADVLTIERVKYRPKVPKPDPNDPKKTIYEDGPEQERVDVRLDWERMQDTGALDLLKKVKWGEHGPEIELYDAQAALVHIGKHHGLFVERQELTGKNGGPIELNDARRQLIARLARRTADAEARGTDDDAGGSAG